MTKKNGALAPRGSACLEKGRCYLFTLATAGADLALMINLEALLWIA
jgi:hypothetical protein